MLVRDALEVRGLAPSRDEPTGPVVRLPRTLKLDRVSVRTGLLHRLWSARSYALGDRSGVLRAAGRRSGGPFRLDVRQRVIVKALVSRHMGRGSRRGAALARHLAYLGRAGAGADGQRPVFLTRETDAAAPDSLAHDWAPDRHHFRFIISPEHGDRLALEPYVREVMGRVAADLGEPQLQWVATCHYDTDQPHAHVLVRGRRGDGRDLVIPRDYMGYGFRARAQEAAQERLGDLSRIEAERRVWKETQTNRFTGLDRRLLQAAGADRLVEDGVGSSDVWSALTRGRLRRLEGLGLAIREGRRYRLDAALEPKLRALQLRTDVIRTLNQRRLEAGRPVALLEAERVRGVVVKSGYFDELGASGWVIVRDRQGAEHLGRLGPGQPLPDMGTSAELLGAGQGRCHVLRAAQLER